MEIIEKVREDLIRYVNNPPKGGLGRYAGWGLISYVRSDDMSRVRSFIQRCGFSVKKWSSLSYDPDDDLDLAIKFDLDDYSMATRQALIASICAVN